MNRNQFFKLKAVLSKVLPIIIFAISLIVTSTANVANAITCDTERIKEGDPHLTDIVCPIIQTINIFVFSAGLIFIIYVVFAAYKYYTSMGDPKAAMGAQKTLTTALMGFFLIIGVFTILYLIANLLGIDTAIINPFDKIQESLDIIVHLEA